jgi:hypothetical protein
MAETKIVNLQISDNLNATTESVKSLKAQLREAQNDVTQLSEKFGATSKEAINAAKKAGILKDAIGDAKALTDAFNPDAKFKALSSSLSGVAGGFAAVQGGMALFGSESENVEKTLLKVQSAMALSQGLQTIGESVDSFKQLGAVLKSNVAVQKVLTASQAAYTTVVGASTGALKLLRIALAATGIGAIVVGLGLLIANFDKVKKAVLNLIPGLAQVGEFFGNIVESVTDFVGATSEAERALDSLKDAADKTLSVNKKFLAEHGDQIDKYTKQKIDAKNAYAEAIKEEGANTAALAKRLNRELSAIDKQREDDRIKINQEAADKIKAANEKLAAAKKAADEKAASIEKARFKTQQEIRDQDLKNQEQLDAEKKERDNLAKAAADKKIVDDFAKMSADLKAQRDQGVADEKEAADKKAEIARLEYEGKREILAKTANILSTFADMLGQQTAEGKALAIATATINAYLGISEVWKAKNIYPEPFGTGVKIASTIAVATAAFSNVKKILSVQVPGGGGGGSAPSMPATASVPAAPQFNVVGTSGVNQIAQGLGNQSPVQAYVVGSQVTTQQALDRNIVRTATLGG